MVFLYLHSREDGDRSALTHSFDPTHTCIGKHHSGILLRAGYPGASAASVSGADLNSLSFPSAHELSRCLQLICQQSIMLYILIEVYLSNLATRASSLELITMSGFSYVEGSIQLTLVLFRPNFSLWMAALTSKVNSMACMLAFWKFKSIEANYTSWCKIRIDMWVEFNLSASLVT